MTDVASPRSLPRRAALPLLLLAWAAAPAWAQEGQQEAPQQRQLPRDLSAYPGLDKIQLQYDSVRIDGTVFRLSGDVDLVDSEHGIRLLADELSFDVEELTFEASGNVSFEQDELLLNGTRMSGDLDAGTLEMDGAKGVAPGPFYVRAERIVQIEPGKFKVEHGIVSPCNQTTAIWEFRSGNMTFKPGSYVTMAWPHVRVKGLPILGLPYVYWPLQDSNRQTGFLIPAIGTSTRKGFMLSQSFFWAISRSADMTATYEHFSAAGSGFGGEFRHALSESASGFLRAYYLPGREITPEEEAEGAVAFPRGFSLIGSHVQALPAGFILRFGANFISSTDFSRGFQDSFDRFLQRQSMITTDISRSWGAGTLTVVADYRENFNSDRNSTVGQRLPQVKFQLRSTQVAGPLYVGLQTSAAHLRRVDVSEDNRGNVVEQGGTYNRFDAFPDLQLQVTQIPWLTFNPFFRWRSTYWDTRLDNRGDFLKESVFRNYYETGLEVVGPSIFKIYDTPTSGYSPRLKHLIQPRITYRRLRELDADFLRRIINFDEVDSRPTDTQSLQVAVTTRLFAKRYLNPQDDQRQVWQTAEVTIGRDYLLDPISEFLESVGAPRIQSPWFLSTLMQPTNRLYLRADLRFTPNFDPVNFNFQSRMNLDFASFDLSWFRGARTLLDPDDFTNVLVEPSSNSLRAGAGTDLFGRALSLAGGIEMDLLQDRLLSANGSVKWNLQCCSIGVDLRYLNFQSRQETQFSFVLELAQVGSLGFDNQRR